MIKKYKLLLAALLGIFLSVIVIFFVNQKLNIPNGKNIFAPRESAKPISVTVVAEKGQRVIKVSLNPKSQLNVSSFSLRLTYDASSGIMPVSFTPDSSLMTAGWSFPVKKISRDSVTGLINVDISAINITPEGYTLAVPTSLGTIDFEANQQISSLTLSLDKSETKILAKDASQLNYNYIYQ